jgi:hypothetical protein
VNQLWRSNPAVSTDGHRVVVVWPESTVKRYALRLVDPIDALGSLPLPLKALLFLVVAYLLGKRNGH